MAVWSEVATFQSELLTQIVEAGFLPVDDYTKKAQPAATA